MNCAVVIEYALCTATFVILALASISDIRKREVSDIYWNLLGVVGIGGNFILGLIDTGFEWDYPINALACCAFLYSLTGNHGSRDAYIGVLAVIVSLAAFLLGSRSTYAFSSTLAVVVGVLYVFGYWSGVVRGGADTKCLISLGFALPIYPSVVLSGYVPDMIETYFVPSIAVMFIASIISVIGCSMYCVARNFVDNTIPSIRGYYTTVEKAEKSFVWPMECVIDGVPTACEIPDDEEMAEVYREFREEGISEIFVTPMVPFVVPITLAFLIVILVGSPFTLLC